MKTFTERVGDLHVGVKEVEIDEYGESGNWLLM
jgi:hypothetical protein